MSVTLTQQAATHIGRYLQKRGKGIGLRLGVRTTGCSGMAYKLEYVDDVAPEDVVFESFGVKSSSTEKPVLPGRHRTRLRP